MQGDVGPGVCGAADLKTTMPANGTQHAAAQPSAPPNPPAPQSSQNKAGRAAAASLVGERDAGPQDPLRQVAAAVPQPGSGQMRYGQARVHCPLRASPGFHRTLWSTATPPERVRSHPLDTLVFGKAQRHIIFFPKIKYILL